MNNIQIIETLKSIENELVDNANVSTATLNKLNSVKIELKEQLNTQMDLEDYIGTEEDHNRSHWV